MQVLQYKIEVAVFRLLLTYCVITPRVSHSSYSVKVEALRKETTQSAKWKKKNVQVYNQKMQCLLLYKGLFEKNMLISFWP